MATLKGVIFGVEDVLIQRGKLAPQVAILAETGKLIRFLKSRGIDSAVLTNQSWNVQTNSGTQSLQQFVETRWGVKLNWYQCAKDGMPPKQSAESIAHVRNQKGWNANETLFVGNSEVDMQAAVNGKILLLNAHWYDHNMDYGFAFDSPKEVARFVDTFCLREHLWYFQIDDPPIRSYALAPLGSYFNETKYYSEDFLKNVKRELGEDQEFWVKFLCTGMYFSGVYEEVDYISPYPKHQAGEYPEILTTALTTFAKCFRTAYIPNLIDRHTTALKSQFNRNFVKHDNQLDTIRLNPTPERWVKGSPRVYKNFPIKKGKSVLVIDDVCTKGMSFEGARAYLSAVGANVISVSFLKALNHDYEALNTVRLPNGPFRKNKGIKTSVARVYSFVEHVTDRQAPAELTDRLRQYQNWDWPDGL